MEPDVDAPALDAINKEMCKKGVDLVYKNSDRRIKVEEIAQPLVISHGSILTINNLTQSFSRLQMLKPTDRCVPKPHSDDKTKASVCSVLIGGA